MLLLFVIHQVQEMSFKEKITEDARQKTEEGQYHSSLPSALGLGEIKIFLV